MFAEAVSDVHAKIDAKSTQATGDSKDVRRMSVSAVQITGISGVWSVVLEGAFDEEVTWHPIATITANGLTSTVATPLLGLPWRYIRLRTATVGTGTLAAFVAGRMLA